MRVSLIALPYGWALHDPPDISMVTGGWADAASRFVRSAAEIAVGLPSLGRRIVPAGAIWFAWPRRAAGQTSDVTDEATRAAVLPRGLVDVKVCAIDDDWSGLRAVGRSSGAGGPVSAIWRSTGGG